METAKDWLKHLSFSSLTTYENCPRCFFLKYKMKIWDDTKSPSLFFGREVHDQIALYHGWEKPEWKEKLDEECPDEIKYEIKPYLEIYKTTYNEKHDGVEKEFLVDFRHPDTGKSLGFPIKGIIDLIKDGYVIDHKTSSSRYTKRMAHDMKQLSIYSYAYRKLFGKKEKGLKLNVFLKRKTASFQSMEVMESTRDESDYADFWYWAKPLVNKIMAGRFEKNHRPKEFWFKHLDVCL